MTNNNLDHHLNSRSLETIFKEHLDNSLDCAKVLGQLFSNLDERDLHIEQAKILEEKGDKLTEEAFRALEHLTYSEYIRITEELIKRLDDIVDGLNNTARLIDICHPKQIEDAAQDMLKVILSMIDRLRIEIGDYPNNDLANVRACSKELKRHESSADTLYHDWRKKQRSLLVMSLIDESNWTEILGVLEETTDAAYHAALLLERIIRYRQRA